MKPKLFIVTGNPMKFSELSEKLGEFFDCEQKVFNELEIQGSPEEILKHKINQTYELFQSSVLVDDVSLHFEELNGFPGPYIKHFMECMNPYDIGVKFAGTKVKAICWLGLCLSPGNFIIAKGEISGRVVKPKEKDHQDRYFDIFFQVDGMDKPMIEYSYEEKNEFSHRGIAMKNLLEILRKKDV